MEVEQKIAEALQPQRCPKCGKKMWKVIETEKGYYIRINIKEYNTRIINGIAPPFVYECPECGEIKGNVKKFLKGKKYPVLEE